MLCATREEGAGVSGIVSGGVLGVKGVQNIAIGRSLLLGCKIGAMAFETLEWMF